MTKHDIESLENTEINGDVKRQKICDEDVRKYFAPGLFERAEELRKQNSESVPYKHCVIDQLMDDSLLRDVRKEILKELVFTRRETDIYRVNQTGDLANLDGLDQDELKKLSSLRKLRNVLYSSSFRELVREITGCGALSGKKQDMSINNYRKTCHLLNHDDVIGSRRVSYILYLTDPDEPWKPEWGGALRLYPTVTANVPAVGWTKVIPPAWNQLAFFTVQPGHSFHDVEEVYVDKDRLAVSGWFHIPQEGEPGFIAGEQEETEAKSSLHQLISKELIEYDFPKTEMLDIPEVYLNTTLELPSATIEYLSKYINPVYLKKESLTPITSKFYDDSVAELYEFLAPEFAEALKAEILKIERDYAVLPETKPDEEFLNFKISAPPHKWRYQYYSPKKGDSDDSIFAQLQYFLSSGEFSQWVNIVATMHVKKCSVLVRRFRPGLDFTLATVQDNPGYVVDGTLGLSVIPDGKRWSDIPDCGGFQMLVATDDDDENDPAVYREAGDDDGVLAADEPQFNHLQLVLRDQGTLDFVKYLSRDAITSRWDCRCRWEGEENVQKQS
ncbi:hypothetical protein CANCADRAFT_32513 [Tortispora caseinolytica NRRL Y-17796]|uniref:uS12 prolyl 3,4-dihydroxylase n=1 Tax=Tortispora caseinolytica NRRL Y-17796 TaxID=767744 RepID=A0A1E4TBR3_9ASCO|nr:hypothetical protein CANCADRAFT_32513 [Tortispora caseinolytica NRRL Y-17796]